MDLCERLRTVVFLDSDAEAIEFESVWHPWAALQRVWEGVDSHLDEFGAGESATVGVVLRNRPECAATIAALLGTGRCLVTLSPLQADADLAGDIARLPLAAVVATESDWEREGFADAVEASGALGIAIGGSVGEVRGQMEPAGEISTRVRPGIAVEMLTSGTTGPPKRVPLPYRNLAHSIEILSHYRSSDDGADDVRLSESVTILFSPLSHISGTWGVVEAVSAGRKLALLEQFRADAWLDLVRRFRPKFSSLPPTCMRMVLDTPGVTKEDLSSLRAVRAATAPLDPSMADEFEERFGVPVLIAYGATEFAGAVVGWTLRDHDRFHKAKRGSAGRAHPGIELRVVDPESGDVLGEDEVGILEVTGDQLAGLDSSEWIRTQDLARIDSDGFVWLRGRTDDVIIRGGFKVDTGRVASVLERHAAVRAAGVVGVADRRLGAVPVAVIEPEKEGRVTAEELADWARGSLSVYEQPVRFILVDELPRTATLKVSRRALEQLAATVE